MDDDETLFFENTPLPQTETSVTLELYSLESPSQRGEVETPSFQKRIHEGQITLEPTSIQLFALPPQRQTSAFSFAPDRNIWDLYLAIIPFTLHQPEALHAYYSQVTFVITLHTQHATAFDLFPRDILSPVEKRKFTISHDGRFSLTDDPHMDIARSLSFSSLLPIIQAYGVGENTFYWKFAGSGERKSVPFDTKHVLAVLRVPRGTSLIEGEIDYQINVRKPLFRMLKSNHAKVDPYPIRWPLHNLRSLFSPEPEAMAVDVCLVCALSEEAKALIDVIEEQCHVHVEEGYDQKLKRDYRHVWISNHDGEALHILITWLPNPGSTEASLLFNDFIREHQPRFVGMTGFCAGDQKKTALGDIIVAERAFSYETGKIELDERGQKRRLSDVTTWQIQPGILQTLRMFRAWEASVEQLERPISLRQQRDWLLATLLHTSYQSISAIPEQERTLHAPQWRYIWWRQLHAGPTPYVTSEGALTEQAKQLLEFREDFPYEDPPHPRVHIGPVATGDKVRADDPFEEINQPVRKTLALDMEGAAFYRVMANFPATPALFVKGVSDYATPEKDDRFHRYAASVSAAYMLSFIRTYVTTERFPRR